MTLGEMLRDRIEDMGPWQEGARAATVREADLEVRCALNAADAVGVAVEELALRPTGPGELRVERVTAWAREICERVTYLLEPLRLLEVDTADAMALVRSVRPRKRGQERSYYELVIGPDQAVSLRRLRSTAGSRRAEPVPFALTLEQLTDLVDDLVAARPGA